jgi:hypothetical protein
LAANDRDVDSRIAQIKLEAPPMEGTLQLSANGHLIYTPFEGFFGIDEFKYKASDGFADSLTSATVTLRVLFPGDTELDGDVDIDDFLALKEGFPEGTTRAEGDLDGDGDVDLFDFRLLKDNFGAKAVRSSPLPRGLSEAGASASAVVVDEALAGL